MGYLRAVTDLDQGVSLAENRSGADSFSKQTYLRVVAQKWDTWLC